MSLLKDSGLALTVDEADEVFLFLDSDGSGSVSWREFIRILTRGGAPPGAEALARTARREARSIDASLRAGKGIAEATISAATLAGIDLTGSAAEEEEAAEASLDPLLPPQRKQVLAQAFDDLALRYRADAGGASAGGSDRDSLPFDWLVRQCDASQLPPVLLSAEAEAAMHGAGSSAGIWSARRPTESAVPNDLQKGGGAQALSLLVGGCEELAALAGSVPGLRRTGVAGGGGRGGGNVTSAHFAEMHEGISMQEEDDGAFSLRVGLVWRVDSLATMPGSVAAAGPRGKAAAEATTSLAVLAVLASGDRVMLTTKPGPFFRRGDRATERILVEQSLRLDGRSPEDLVRWSFDF